MTPSTTSGTRSGCHAINLVDSAHHTGRLKLKTKDGRVKSFIATGLFAGIIWGWLAMAINTVSGVFPFEGTFLSNWAAFTVAGGLFGAAVCGAMRLLSGVLPFKRTLANPVLVSVGFWLVLRVGGALLSAVEPGRFHVVTLQTLQGLFLSVALGVIVWLIGGFLGGLTGKKDGAIVRH